MKIAITANSAWNLLNFRLSLIERLIQEGHTVIAIAPKDGAEETLKEKANVEFIPLDSLSRKGSNPYQDLKLIKEFRKIYATHKIDISIQYTIKPNIYGSIAGGPTNTKTISNLTGLGYLFLSDSLKTKIAKKLYKVALKKTSFACFHNAIDATLFENLKLVSPNKTKVINGSGVDTNYFNCIPRHKNNKFIFLFIGRLLFDKGITELLEAFGELQKTNPTIELHLLGDIDSGNLASLSEIQLNQYKKELTIIHHGMQKDVKPFINQSDCVVLPSYREGLPKSLLEAMSMERPIITVNSPGCEHLIENDRNGFLAEVKNSKSLAQQMKRMLELTVEQRSALGRYGRQLVLEKYSSEIINNEYIKLISQISA